MITSEHDPGRYKKCMQEIKNRIAIFDSAMLPFRAQRILQIANLELACLQLRKAFELIGLASISANKAKYAEIRKSFEKDWNLPEILKTIERFNPQFLPIGIRETPSDNPKVKPHQITENGRTISRDQLIQFHGRIGQIMHARNPYAPELRYLAWHEWCCEKRDDLVALLSNHAVNVDFQHVFYLCSMQNTQDSEVSVTMCELVSEKELSHAR